MVLKTVALNDGVCIQIYTHAHDVYVYMKFSCKKSNYKTRSIQAPLILSMAPHLILLSVRRRPGKVSTDFCHTRSCADCPKVCACSHSSLMQKEAKVCVPFWVAKKDSALFWVRQSLPTFKHSRVVGHLV